MLNSTANIVTSEPPALEPNTGEPTAACKLTKAHTRRLRFYTRIHRPVTQDDLTDLDLEVMGLIAVNRTGMFQGNKVEITDLGRQAIFQDRQSNIASQTPHHALASRLAEWLRSSSRLTWENIEFKAEFGPNDFCHVRPDVFSIVPTYDLARLAPLIHEVKVTRADFLSDLAKPWKRQAYQQLAGSVFYVAPEGVISPDDVPEDCGLVVERAPGDFVKAKNVRAKKFQLNSRSLIKLVLASYGQAE